MAHLALYRTYRPQDFDSVVGQKHIVQTVKNQIKNDLLAHAYMLTGPRGTGKTSIARIVAKAINCTNAKNGNPCNSCESCLAVSNGNHPDVLELDGASNNGVDEIREIRERAKYSPSLSPYKVYIIDEVHMLSTGAFNALLKTLEEPPTHVIFMLATTEIHKVPDTILSRVQRFDLKQIPASSMSDHLKRILDELEVGFENGVPELVATLAAGGLRDALSMLDQAIAYKIDIVKLSDIHDLNGSVGSDALVGIIEHVLASDFAGVVESARGLLALGKLPARIIDGLLGVLRDVLKVQKVGGLDHTGLAVKLDSGQVLSFIKKLNSLAHELKIATDAELILEIGLIELGFAQEVVINRPTDTTTADYGEEIQILTKQVRELQAEVSGLRGQRMTVRPARVPTVKSGVSVGDAPPVSQLSAPDFPVFVQGELVNGESFEISVDDSIKAEPNVPVINGLPDPQAMEIGDQHVGANDLLIEQILATATKQDKAKLQSQVTAANPFEKLDVKEVVMLLKDAEITAASPEGCILVYEYETTAQKLLTDENRDKAFQMLADMMGYKYGFLALPKEFWLAQRASYVVQSKQGNAPILEQYPQRMEVKATDAVISELEVTFYQEVVDMFGDVVEIND